MPHLDLRDRERHRVVRVDANEGVRRKIAARRLGGVGPAKSRYGNAEHEAAASGDRRLQHRAARELEREDGVMGSVSLRLNGPLA